MHWTSDISDVRHITDYLTSAISEIGHATRPAAISGIRHLRHIGNQTHYQISAISHIRHIRHQPYRMFDLSEIGHIRQLHHIRYIRHTRPTHHMSIVVPSVCPITAHAFFGTAVASSTYGQGSLRDLPYPVEPFTRGSTKGANKGIPPRDTTFLESRVDMRRQKLVIA